MYDFCNEELQSKLRYYRDKKEKEFEMEFANKRAKIDDSKSSASSAAASASAPDASTEVAMELEGLDEEEAAALREAMKLSMSEAAAEDEAAKKNAEEKPETVDSAPTSTPPAPFGNGLPNEFTGKYELHAIVTHKGRSADSGHYMGWVRQSPGSAYWWCYDDDKVTEVSTEDIMKLKGGGDRDMAYLNFYRFKESD